MVPVTLVRPLWWVARRLPRLVIGLAVTALGPAVIAGGEHAAMAASAGGRPVVAADSVPRAWAAGPGTDTDIIAIDLVAVGGAVVDRTAIDVVTIDAGTVARAVGWAAAAPGAAADPARTGPDVAPEGPVRAVAPDSPGPRVGAGHGRPVGQRAPPRA